MGLTVEDMKTSRVGLVEKEGDQFIPLKSKDLDTLDTVDISYT